MQRGFGLSVGPLQMTRLRELALDLGHSQASRLRLDRFLLELLTNLKGPVITQIPVPEWLSEAITRWQRDQQAMETEVSGLAELANRSREHVKPSDQRDRGPSRHGPREHAADGSRQGDAAPIRHPPPISNQPAPDIDSTWNR
jgi:hypothetical protein